MTEALVALAVLGILGGAIVSIFHQSQASYRAQIDQAERIQQVRIAMDQIARCLRQAGNDPLEQISALPVIPLENGGILITSDITGSEASVTGNPAESTGDPDGRLTSIYERVTFRYDSQNRAILSDVGYGEEVLAEGITLLSFDLLDLTGNVTSDNSQIARVKVKIVGESEKPDMRNGLINTVTLESDVLLRSRIPQVIPEG